MSFCLWLTGLPGSGKSTILKDLLGIFCAYGTDYVRSRWSGLFSSEKGRTF